MRIEKVVTVSLKSLHCLDYLFSKMLRNMVENGIITAFIIHNKTFHLKRIFKIIFKNHGHNRRNDTRHIFRIACIEAQI